MLKALSRSLLTSSLGFINNPGQGNLRRGVRGFSGVPGITVCGVDSHVRGYGIVATVEHHDTVKKGGLHVRSSSSRSWGEPRYGTVLGSVFGLSWGGLSKRGIR